MPRGKVFTANEVDALNRVQLLHSATRSQNTNILLAVVYSIKTLYHMIWLCSF